MILWQSLEILLQKPLQQVLNLAKAIVTMIKTFASSNTIKTLKTVLDCGIKAGKWAVGIVKVIYGFYSKIQEIAEGLAADGVGVVVPIADIITGLICKWKDFATAVDDLIKAFKQRDANKRAQLLGRFLGRIVYAIGTA